MESQFKEKSRATIYQIMHHYDIGDRSVKFMFTDFTIQEVKDLAVYIQFKAENLLGDAVSLQNRTVVDFLELYGANSLVSADDMEQESLTVIDMYDERESRICGNNWYAENYDSFDLKYGEIATKFLLEKSNGKDLDSTLI